MLRTAQSLPLKGFRRWASTRPVSRPSRQPATGPPGSYPDRTSTGKRRRAYDPRSTTPVHLQICWTHERRRLAPTRVARFAARVNGSQEPEPPPQVQTVRARRLRRPASRLHVPQIGRSRLDRYPVGADEPERLPGIVSADETTMLRYDQGRKIPHRLRRTRTNGAPASKSLTSRNSISSSVNR
jgi:hypothetical protein